MAGSVSGLGGGAMPKIVSGASKRASSSQGLSQMFQTMDTSGAGSISKSNLQSALQNLSLPSSVKSLGADTLFNKLDTNKTGSVSRQDFVSGLRKIMSGLQVQGASSTQNGSSASSSAAQFFNTALNEGSSSSSGGSLGSIVNTYA